MQKVQSTWQTRQLGEKNCTTKRPEIRSHTNGSGRISSDRK